MKLSIFDRVLLALLLIIVIVFSFVLFGMATNLITEEMVTGLISLFYYAWQNALILAGAACCCLPFRLSCCSPAAVQKRPSNPRRR